MSVITHRHLCPRHCDHSQCLSLSLIAFSRRLASLSRGLRPRTLCLVRVPYIRTRTIPFHSYAPRSLASLSLSRQRPLSTAVSLSRASCGTSLSRRATHLVSLASPLSSPLRRGSARLHKYSYNTLHICIFVARLLIIIIYFNFEGECTFNIGARPRESEAVLI